MRGGGGAKLTLGTMQHGSCRFNPFKHNTAMPEIGQQRKGGFLIESGGGERQRLPRRAHNEAALHRN